MSTLNDEKYRALRTLFATGTVKDMERAYLKDQIVTPPVSLHINDMWHEFWDKNLIGPGATSERAFEWLATKGITTGVLSERWKAYWETIV